MVVCALFVSYQRCQPTTTSTSTSTATTTASVQKHSSTPSKSPGPRPASAACDVRASSRRLSVASSERCCGFHQGYQGVYMWLKKPGPRWNPIGKWKLRPKPAGPSCLILSHTHAWPKRRPCLTQLTRSTSVPSTTNLFEPGTWMAQRKSMEKPGQPEPTSKGHLCQ